MKLTSISEIKKILGKELSVSRYHHSLSVARLAKKLASVHHVDPDVAERIGLVHDCAKEWSPSEFSRYVKKKKIHVPCLEYTKRIAPNMMHAYVGAVVAYERGWIARQHQKPIASHTLANFKMSVLDKIIYVADFASYDRDYKQAKKIRKVALANLHRAFVMSMRFKMVVCLKKSKPIHPFALDVWNHIVDH